MVPTFVLFAAAMLAVWCPRSLKGVPIWCWLAGGAVVSGLFSGMLGPAALWAIGGWALLARHVGDLTVRTVPVGWLALLAAVAAGFLLHLWPGFNNVKIVDAARLSPDAVPYSLYLNADKALVALGLLGWCHPRATTAVQWRRLLRASGVTAVGLIVVVGALAFALDYVRWAPKLPPFAALWLAVNLLATCTAEEALFRGLVQAQAQRHWAGRPGGQLAALLLASALFGLAHLGGGGWYVLLASVAGFGYGWVYQRTGRIEAGILVHFALNTVHFLLFTYPAVEPAGVPL